MRILFISASSGSRGGGEIFLIYLAAALRARGHVVGLWISDHTRMDELASAFKPHGDVIRAAYPWFYDSWHRGLLGELTGPADHALWREQWTAWNPDIIHINKQCLEDGLDLLVAAKGMDVPRMATIHITQTAHSLGARLGALRDWRARRALQRCDTTLVAVSAARGSELRSLLGKTAGIEVIDNGVPLPVTTNDRASLRRSENLGQDTFAVVSVGRLEAQKNPLRFLDVVSRLHAKLPTVRARWIGGGRMEIEWLRARKELGLDDVVRLDSWRSDVAKILPAFDLFLHTADFEGLPLALLEGMAAGLPAVVSSGVYGQLPPHLQSAVKRLDADTDLLPLINDLDGLSALAESGRKAVLQHHSVDAMAAGYESLYRSL